MRHWSAPQSITPEGYSPFKDRSGHEMRIVESDVLRRGVSVLALNIDVARVVVTNAQHMSRIVEGEAGLVKILATGERLSIRGDEFRHEIQAEHV